MGDSVDKVLDKIMDDAIASAKKVVGNCNERWKGELNLDTRQFYQEKHTNNFSFDILEEEPTTDYFYKPIIGSGKVYYPMTSVTLFYLVRVRSVVTLDAV